MIRSVVVLVAVALLLASAALIAGPGISALVPSVLLVLGGLFAFFLSPVLARAEQQLARKHSWLNVESEARPLKYKLWGIGVVIVGVAWLFIGAQ